MAFQLQAIREGLAAAITGVFATNGEPIQVYAYDLQSVEYPAVIILPDSGTTISYGDTFGNNAIITTNWIVHIRCSAADPKSAQIQLMRLMNSGSAEPRSIPDALEVLRVTDNTPTLNGVVANVYVDTGTINPVQAISETGPFEVPGDIKITVRSQRS